MNQFSMYFGTSIGIAVRDNHLDVVCLRGRGRSVIVTGFLRVEGFLSRPVAEVAQQYQRFRRDNHALATSALVALPRGAGLVRTLDLPAEVQTELARAIAYQVDSLHPFEEGSVYFDYGMLPEPHASSAGDGAAMAADTQGRRLRAAVALVEKDTLDRLYEWFCRTGMDVAGFTLSTAALYQVLGGAAPEQRLNGHGARRPLVLVDRRGQALEILGLAADGAFYSKEVAADAPLRKEVEFCIAELRVNPEESPLLLRTGDSDAAPTETAEAAPEGTGFAQARLEEGLLAATPEIRSAEFRLREHLVAYAAALPGIERRLPGLAPPPGLRWNLLPAEKRIYRSHWAHVAAGALAALALVLFAAWGMTGWVQDRLYASWLNSEINKLAPRVQYLERLDTRQKSLLAKLELLERQRGDIPRKLEAWGELTRLVPHPAWLQNLQFNDSQVMAMGQADSASNILQALSQSVHFQQPEFSTAISKNPEGREVFQIRMRLRELVMAPPVAVSSAPAGSVAPGAPAGGVLPSAPAPAAAPPAAPAKKGGG